jgi:NAD(P)-dependent dehydrogenase (short-subunit alcohol dehydrogenase family)
VVLVTGGVKGIGAAIVRSLTEEGAIPIAVDRDATACEQLREELNEDSRARFIAVDLSFPDNCRVEIERSIEACGLLAARTGHITGQRLFVDGGYVHLDLALM